MPAADAQTCASIRHLEMGLSTEAVATSSMTLTLALM
jgi:hypothetical protein